MAALISVFWTLSQTPDNDYLAGASHDLFMFQLWLVLTTEGWPGWVSRVTGGSHTMMLARLPTFTHQVLTGPDVDLLFFIQRMACNVRSERKKVRNKLSWRSGQNGQNARSGRCVRYVTCVALRALDGNSAQVATRFSVINHSFTFCRVLDWQVAYFTATFPYIMLTVLVVRGATLPGALQGITYFFSPSWQQLARPEVSTQ